MTENSGNNNEQQPQQPQQPQEPEAPQQPPAPQPPAPEQPPAQQPPASQPPAPQPFEPQQPAAQQPQPGGEHPGFAAPGQPDQQPAAANAAASGQSEQREYARAPQVNIKTPGFLKPLKPHHWMTLLLSQLASYAVLLFIAVLTIIGFILGTVLDVGDAVFEFEATGMDPTAEEMGFTGVLAAFTLPFQLVGVWLFGSLQITMSMPEEMQGMVGGDTADTLNLWAPNLLVVGCAVAIAVWGGRLFSRRRESAVHQVPLLPKLVAVTASSFIVAGLTWFISFIATFRRDFSELGAELEVVVTTAGLDIFFGAFLVYLVIGLLLVVTPGVFSKLGGKINYFLPSAGRVPRVLGIHALVALVPALIAVTATFGIEGGPVAALTFFFWASTVAVVSFVALNGGAVVGGATMPAQMGGSPSETYYLWTWDELVWWQTLLGFVVGLLAIFLASMAWTAGRDTRASTLANILSWVTLPLIYGLVGVALIFCGQIRAGVYAGVSGTMAFGPAWWTFLVFLLVGVVIEVLSRFLGPVIMPKLPGVFQRLLGGKKAQA